MKLQGARCIITGASRGIGRAIATRFEANGAQCYLLAAHKDTLEESWKKKAYPLPGSNQDAKQYKQDIGDADQGWPKLRFGLLSSDTNWDALAQEVGTIDVLVNAAGISQSALLIKTSSSIIHDILDVNLSSTILGCKSIARRMISTNLTRRSSKTEPHSQHEKTEKEYRKPGSSCIINVSSLLALKSGAGSAVYAASKAGVLGLTRALAAELGPAGIRVNAITPGYIDTSMTHGIDGELRKRVLDQIPSKRFGTPEEVAEAAAFLVENEYANNCVINLDGGLSAM